MSHLPVFHPRSEPAGRLSVVFLLYPWSPMSSHPDCPLYQNPQGELSCLTSEGDEVPATGVCVEDSWAAEMEFGPANSRLLADPEKGS